MWSTAHVSDGTDTSSRPVRRRRAAVPSAPDHASIGDGAGPAAPVVLTSADILRKPVNALAIVPKSARITFLARKAYNVLLYEAQEQGIEQSVYRVPLEQIIRGIDFDSHDTELVKRHLRAMVGTTVEWQSPTTGEGTVWNVSGLLAHARLSKERGQVWVEWSYAINLKQQLIEPTVFARLRLEIITQLRSHAALALYEICSRYRDVGRTSRHPWRWWHPVLTGQPPDPLKLEKAEYRIFKRDVLKGAVAEVTAISDLDIEMIEHRRGRFVDEIQFSIAPKRQAPLPLNERRQPVDMSILTTARRLGLDEAALERLADQYGFERVRDAMPVLERRATSAYPAPLRDPARYLKALLANAPQTEDQPESLPVAASPPADPASRPGQVRTEWLAIWRQRRAEQVRAEIAAMGEGARAELLARVEQDLTARSAHPSVLKRLRTSGWSHPMVLADVVRAHASAVYGPNWDQPSAEQLLALAAELSALDR